MQKMIRYNQETAKNKRVKGGNSEKLYARCN